MENILTANIFTLIGQIFALCASVSRDKKRILFHQSSFMFFISISSYLLKGYSAIVTNVVAIVRNVLSVKGWNHKGINYIMILLTFIVGIMVNTNSYFGYMIIVVTIFQSLVILNERSTVTHIRMVSALSSFCWAIFNGFIKSYVGALFNIVNCLMYLYSITKDHKRSL